MVSRFTNLISRLREMGMTIEDIDYIIELECHCLEDIDWINENIAGANSREDEIARTIDYYNGIENEIYIKYEKR